MRTGGEIGVAFGSIVELEYQTEQIQNKFSEFLYSIDRFSCFDCSCVTLEMPYIVCVVVGGTKHFSTLFIALSIYRKPD